MPSLEEQIKFYNSYWENFEPISLYKHIRLIKILEYLLHIRKQIKFPNIIDLGCGDGRLVSLWNEFGSATGVDLSEKAMLAAKKRYHFIEFKQGNALSTEFNSQSFDVVISQEVIEHIEDQIKYIEECHRLLNDGGYLIITTPNKNYFKLTKEGNYSRQPIENLVSLKQLEKMIGMYFKIIKVETIIFSKIDYGIFSVFFNKYVSKLLKLLRMNTIKKVLIKKSRLGLNICLLAQKKS